MIPHVPQFPPSVPVKLYPVLVHVAIAVPVRVAVADVAKPLRLAVTETVAEAPLANPAWVTVPPLRDTLPALVVTV